jgi:hypothetical protein
LLLLLLFFLVVTFDDGVHGITMLDLYFYFDAYIGLC